MICVHIHLRVYVKVSCYPALRCGGQIMRRCARALNMTSQKISNVLICIHLDPLTGRAQGLKLLLALRITWAQSDS